MFVQLRKNRKDKIDFDTVSPLSPFRLTTSQKTSYKDGVSTTSD